MTIWISLMVVSWQGTGIEVYRGECPTLNFGVKTAQGSLDVTEELLTARPLPIISIINPIQGRSTACECGPSSIFSPGTVSANHRSLLQIPSPDPMDKRHGQGAEAVFVGWFKVERDGCEIGRVRFFFVLGQAHKPMDQISKRSPISAFRRRLRIGHGQRRDGFLPDKLWRPQGRVLPALEPALLIEFPAPRSLSASPLECLGSQ